jgi:hypothetical protein
MIKILTRKKYQELLEDRLYHKRTITEMSAFRDELLYEKSTLKATLDALRQTHQVTLEENKRLTATFLATLPSEPLPATEAEAQATLDNEVLGQVKAAEYKGVTRNKIRTALAKGILIKPLTRGQLDKWEVE